MLTKRITGLAAIVAAFMVANFAAATESKATTLNTTFEYSDAMRVNAPVRVATQNFKRHQAAPVQLASIFNTQPQKVVKTEKFSAYRHPVKTSVLPQQQKPVYRASNHRLTQNVVDELAKTNSSLHARIIEANVKNAPLHVTPAESEIILGLAAKSDMQLAAAGDPALLSAVITLAIIILPLILPAKAGPDGKPVDNPLVKALTAVICLIPIILSRGAPSSLPDLCKPVA
jgi:hypothetical protein